MDVFLILALLGVVALLLLGVEILVCIGLIVIVITLFTDSLPLSNLGLTLFTAADNFALLALPLYVLTGDLIYESGIANRLIQLARATVGWLRGGLALTGLVASGFFAAISGSNSATVAAMGRMIIPEMEKDDYPVSFSAANVAAGGVVGIIIPPSIVFVIYGSVSGVPVGDLFIAGILPGLVLIATMCVAASLLSARNQWGERVPFTIGALAKGMWGSKLAVGAPLLVLGGIYSGIVTPSEAGVLAVVYCLVAGLLLTRNIKVSDLPRITNNSARISGMLVPIIALAISLAQLITYLNVPQATVGAILNLSSNSLVLTLLILLVLLIAGAIMETGPNVVVLTPLLVPLGDAIGFDPVHFGIIVVVGLAIGFITPPLGLNLFVASSITGEPMLTIAYRAIPFVLALIVGLLLITFIPQLSLFLVPE